MGTLQPSCFKFSRPEDRVIVNRLQPSTPLITDAIPIVRPHLPKSSKPHQTTPPDGDQVFTHRKLASGTPRSAKPFDIQTDLLLVFEGK